MNALKCDNCATLWVPDLGNNICPKCGGHLTEVRPPNIQDPREDIRLMDLTKKLVVFFERKDS